MASSSLGIVLQPVHVTRLPLGKLRRLGSAEVQRHGCNRILVSANNDFLDRIKGDVRHIQKDLKANVENAKATAQTVAKGVKEAGQVLRGTATEVVGQVKEHGQDLQHLRQDLESTVTSYMDPASLKEAKELLKSKLKEMEPKVDSMIDSLPTQRQDLARSIKKAVVSNIQALDQTLDHSDGGAEAQRK